VERGRNPADYALVAFGGAGPLHGARLAKALNVPTLIIPAGAGVGSAVGLLAARSKIDVALTRFMEINENSSSQIADIYTELTSLALDDIKRLDVEPSKIIWSRYAYMRYRGQGHERKIDLPAGDIDKGYAAHVVEIFNGEYRKNYGYLDPTSVIEAVDWYLVGSAAATQNSVSISLRGDGATASAPKTRDVYFPELGGATPCQVVNRYELKVGQKIVGPAIVEEKESTTVVLPGDVVALSPAGSLVVSISQKA
jgi:N-methylhydantoinase A